MPLLSLCNITLQVLCLFQKLDPCGGNYPIQVPWFKKCHLLLEHDFMSQALCLAQLLLRVL